MVQVPRPGQAEPVEAYAPHQRQLSKDLSNSTHRRLTRAGQIAPGPKPEFASSRQTRGGGRSARNAARAIHPALCRSLTTSGAPMVCAAPLDWGRDLAINSSGREHRQRSQLSIQRRPGPSTRGRGRYRPAARRSRSGRRGSAASSVRREECRPRRAIRAQIAAPRRHPLRYRAQCGQLNASRGRAGTVERGASSGDIPSTAISPRPRRATWWPILHQVALGSRTQSAASSAKPAITSSASLASGHTP